MRRKDREITDIVEITQIIETCSVCRLGLWDTEKKIPYIVPLNFGYEWKADNLFIYFHCAKEGRKLELLNKNPNVCFEMDCAHELVEGKNACAYGYHFQSVMGEGTVSKVESNEEKRQALTLLMKQITTETKETFTFVENVLTQTNVLCLEVKHLSCKKNS